MLNIVGQVRRYVCCFLVCFRLFFVDEAWFTCSRSLQVPVLTKKFDLVIWDFFVLVIWDLILGKKVKIWEISEAFRRSFCLKARFFSKVFCLKGRVLMC